jgi:hypothetical protein
MQLAIIAVVDIGLEGQTSYGLDLGTMPKPPEKPVEEQAQVARPLNVVERAVIKVAEDVCEIEDPHDGTVPYRAISRVAKKIDVARPTLKAWMDLGHVYPQSDRNARGLLKLAKLAGVKCATLMLGD